MATNPFAEYKWLALLSDWRIFAEGLKVTLEVAIVALLISIALGILFGIAGVFPNKNIRRLNRIYVEFFQNTPLVIQVIFLYHALPHLKIMLPVFLIGCLGIGLYTGAYMSEAVRSGILAISRGQSEAGLSQGFTYFQTMRYIILPQAKKIILPNIANQSVSLIKNTSVLAMIAGGDLMYRADSWSGMYMYYGPTYLVIGLLYWLMCFPLTKYIKHLEKTAGVKS